MPDMVIRGGQVVDGSGAPAFVGDVSIDQGRITGVGGDAGRGRVEQAVHKQTRRNAVAHGLNDRGCLAPGFKADVNVIDFERLQLETPYWVRDLPANGRRLVQYARGYDACVVGGVVTVRHDEHTGAMPGKLLRGPRRAA